MQTHAVYTLALLLVATVLAPGAQSAEYQPDHAAHSRPILVRFPAPLRDHTLASMRAHLTALADIQGHIAAHRYDIAAEIAEQRLGMSSLTLHGAHEVAKYMPQGMRDAGSAMHLPPANLRWPRRNPPSTMTWASRLRHWQH